MVAARRQVPPLQARRGDAVSARNVTTEEARALLDAIVEADALVCTHDVSSVYYGCLCKSCSRKKVAYGAMNAASEDLAHNVIALRAENARLTRERDAAVAAERARCAARVRDEAHRYDGLKSTATLRAVGAALGDAMRGIESGDTGTDEVTP